MREIAKERNGLGGLIQLNITKDEISEILRKACFTGYRLEGALEWVLITIEMVRKLQKQYDN